MVLALRSDSDQAELYLLRVDGSTARKQVWQAGRSLSDQLLGEIRDLLEAGHCKWQDLTGMVVYHGPGSFTGLRIGITVANAIAYGLKLPIVGSGGEGWQQSGLKSLDGIKPGQPVVPLYGGKVNISKPKR